MVEEVEIIMFNSNSIHSPATRVCGFVTLTRFKFTNCL